MATSTRYLSRHQVAGQAWHVILKQKCETKQARGALPDSNERTIDAVKTSTHPVQGRYHFWGPSPEERDSMPSRELCLLTSPVMPSTDPILLVPGVARLYHLPVVEGVVEEPAVVRLGKPEAPKD